MTDVVDTIVAELIVRDVDKYEAGFNRATAAHEKFLASTGKLKRQTFDLGAEGRKYKAGVDGMAQAEQQASTKVTRARKQRADTVIAQDEREVRSAKVSAKAKADAEIAEATRSARLRKAVETGIANSRVKPGTGAALGRTVPREEGGRALLNATKVGGPAAVAAEIAAEREVNHLLADQAALQSRLTSLKGRDLEYAKNQLAEMQLISQLQRAGIRDEEIALRLEQRRAAIEKSRRSGLLASALGRGSGAGAGDQSLLQKLLDTLDGAKSEGGGGGISEALGGIVGLGIGVAAIQSAIDYGKALGDLSDQLGITVEDLQAYQKMASAAGASQEELSSAFGQFANNLGRAQEGEREQAKVFKAMGINIRDFAKAGDALPTVIDRISQIKDPAKRAALETRLFGESGRKLDAMLSGGAASVSELARSLQETGRALSAQEIKDLDDTARKFAEVKAQMQVDFSRVVAGNAQSIMGLASAFAELANKAINAIRWLKEFDLEQRSKGGLTGLGLGQTQGDRNAAGNELRQLRLRSREGRKLLLSQSQSDLDNFLFDGKGPNPSRDANRQRQDAVRLLRSPTPNGQQRAGREQLERLMRDRKEIEAAERSAAAPALTPPVQLGTVNNRALANLGTPAGPRGPSAESLAKQADQRQRRYEEELARATEDLAQARRQLTGSAEARYQIDLASLAAENTHRKQEIQREANEKQIDASRVKELQNAEDAVYQERLKVLALEKAVRIESDANSLRQQMLDTEVEMLGFQEGMAESTAERRRIAERRLAAERQAETASLNAIIKSSDPNVSEGDRALASGRLASQGDRFAARSAAEARANESPFDSYHRRDREQRRRLYHRRVQQWLHARQGRGQRLACNHRYGWRRGDGRPAVRRAPVPAGRRPRARPA